MTITSWVISNEGRAVIFDILSWLFLLSGGFFLLVGGIGVLRMPDLFTRMHAAGMTDTLGTGLMIIGMLLQAGFTLISVKLLLILIFTFFASPTATHALAQAALSVGIKPQLVEDRRPKDDAGEPS
jgi:multicomponent Na+:H+ antiporter subunit G